MTRPDRPGQRSIFEILGVTPLEQKFIRFHEDNPHVYDELVKSAREFVQATGRTRCGMSLLVARLRWVRWVETTDVDFKLNNNYGAFYSRLIMATEPDLAEMFETRKSIADEVDL